MRTAVDLYKEMFPYLIEVSKILELYIYRPITKGLPMPSEIFKMSGDIPLIDQKQGAVMSTKSCEKDKVQRT